MRKIYDGLEHCSFMLIIRFNFLRSSECQDSYFLHCHFPFNFFSFSFFYDSSKNKSFDCISEAFLNEHQHDRVTNTPSPAKHIGSCMGTWELETIINMVKNQDRDKRCQVKQENDEEPRDEDNILSV